MYGRMASNLCKIPICCVRLAGLEGAGASGEAFDGIFAVSRRPDVWILAISRRATAE